MPVLLQNLGKACRNMDQRVEIIEPGFENDHRSGAALGQATGHDTACRAGTDNDDVAGFCLFRHETILGLKRGSRLRRGSRHRVQIG